ncbi:MAG: SAM-dependent methyltransferase [Planctomycetes bacterium]|nr:SAM-dependent methyltransferase [Planctomycetota bacterium]
MRALEPSLTLSNLPVLDGVERIRLRAARRLDVRERARLGQFLTPAPIARYMASMFSIASKDITLLDAGAGHGALIAAFVERVCQSEVHPCRLNVVAFELDPVLVSELRSTLDACWALCEQAGVHLGAEVIQEDFIQAGAAMVTGGFFGAPSGGAFDCAILNPPYRKIQAHSPERLALRSAGVETVNLYAGFVALAFKLLKPGGQLVALTPRSFCNGPYFRPFRRLFLGTMRLRRIHVFERRDLAFRDDDVLQEHVITCASKDRRGRGPVLVSSSDGADPARGSQRRVGYAEIVRPDDPELFIHIAPERAPSELLEQMRGLHGTLDSLGIQVSTGRVVEFRARDYLRRTPDDRTAPLIYPAHFLNGGVRWPRAGIRKPNAIVSCPQTADLLVPSETYVIVKRFSAKEEPRRVVAAVYDPRLIPCSVVGFENHLNYYHRNGSGLPPDLARGLALFLNSTAFDQLFRSFSGHTQVNATDLRRMPYPVADRLQKLGAVARSNPLSQRQIDVLVEENLFP